MMEEQFVELCEILSDGNESFTGVEILKSLADKGFKVVRVKELSEFDAPYTARLLAGH